MADDERRRLLKRIEALEEASAAIQRELASVKDAVEGLTEEPSGQPARETEPAASLLPRIARFVLRAGYAITWGSVGIFIAAGLLGY